MRILSDILILLVACFFRLGNYTANDGQIYCKPHFLQLFAIKGNYSAGFGLDDHKTRWLSSTSFNEN